MDFQGGRKGRHWRFLSFPGCNSKDLEMGPGMVPGQELGWDPSDSSLSLGGIRELLGCVDGN